MRCACSSYHNFPALAWQWVEPLSFTWDRCHYFVARGHFCWPVRWWGRPQECTEQNNLTICCCFIKYVVKSIYINTITVDLKIPWLWLLVLLEHYVSTTVYSATSSSNHCSDWLTVLKIHLSFTGGTEHMSSRDEADPEMATALPWEFSQIHNRKPGLQHSALIALFGNEEGGGGAYLWGYLCLWEGKRAVLYTTMTHCGPWEGRAAFRP